MKIQHLLPGFIWSPDRDSSCKRYLLKLDKEIKSQFSYVENKNNKQRGYYQGEFSSGSALALYVSEYFGDGIYLSEQPEVLDVFAGASNILPKISDAVYLLVVADGKVVAGTDVIVKRELFDFFIEQIAGTEYSDLNIRALAVDDIFELNRKYVSDAVSENKYSYFMWGLTFIVFLTLCGGVVAWFILMA